MEPFFRTRRSLVKHIKTLIRCTLMDEIDWNDRLISIKGTRGVGKTIFLLQYAQENFENTDHRHLYINMNNFYFQGCGTDDFMKQLAEQGGEVLFIDQVFRQPD